jgi:SCP-2 sterol transfer family
MTRLDHVGEVQEEMAPADSTLAFLMLARDLREVCRIYTAFFGALDAARWNMQAPRGRKEWTLHESIAHLCALNGAGVESIQCSLGGKPYTFEGLETRYQLDVYNRKGIDSLLGLPQEALIAEFLRVHEAAAQIAETLQPGQGELTLELPIYNRPVQIVEALGIIVMHAGLIHSAQVAEPARVPPLWTQLSSDIRHRQIGRVMRAFSLLYRQDIGGSLRGSIAFRVGGAGGGVWHVDLSPDATASGEGTVAAPRLTVTFRRTDDFFRMMTGRLNLPLALLSGRLKLRGNLRLFLRMGKLFSPVARP